MAIWYMYSGAGELSAVWGDGVEVCLDGDGMRFELMDKGCLLMTVF